MKTFISETEIAVPVEFAFAWHEREGAFERLAPAWDMPQVVSRSGGIRDGGEMIFRVSFAPGVKKTWHARHYGYVENKQFCDEQVKGPFAVWKHVHHFERIGAARCRIVDHVEYELPCGAVGRMAPRFMVEDRIAGTFRYRNDVVKRDLERHYRAALEPMRIAISGAGGLIGSELSAFLSTGGHEVWRIARGRSGERTIAYSAEKGFAAGEAAKLEGMDAVIHLAGEPILGVWTAAKKRAIQESRREGTRALAETLAGLSRKPRVLISASAIGYYGDAGENELTEDAPNGEGFLAEVTREWEAACEPARAAGIRVVNPRLGVVLSAKGGALTAMLPAFRLGVGGAMGTGKQFMSWVALEDVLGLFLLALRVEQIHGAMNVCAPSPVRNKELAKTLGGVLNRPSMVPAPSFALKLLPGGMGGETFLASQRAIPKKALAHGYEFAFSELGAALRHQLGLRWK